MSIRGRIHPDGALTRAANRALIASALPRLRRRDDRRSRAIARALAVTASGRFAPSERAWIDRIEARRRRVPEQGGRLDELRLACPYWSIPRLWGRLLMMLVRELEPASCIEMGVGFGMSGAYQAAALELNRGGRLTCLDREDALVELALESFAELGLERRIDLRMGPIGETLAGTAADIAPIDYAYIDAEHTERATVQNFEVVLGHLAPGAVVVVDDVMLDSEMRRAWSRIAANDRVSLALGLRRVGIVVVD